MKYERTASLRDGTRVLIREVRPSDRAAILALFARMSPESVRHRFLGFKLELSASDPSWLGRLDAGRDVALAVVLGGAYSERVLGIGRYVVVTPGSAEVAFEVADPEQGRGIGTLLLQQLAGIARSQGLTTFTADVAADNLQMLEVFDHSGFVSHATIDGGVYRVEMSTEEKHPASQGGYAGDPVTA